MVLKCLIILYAQILSGFENLDIQDLFLNIFILFSAAELSSIEREDDIFTQEFSDEESDYGDGVLKIISNCITGRLNSYFLLNESSSLY